MRNATIKVCCPKCRGSGSIELTGVFADTLRLLQKQGVEMTGVELAAIDGCQATAMNNRLAYLDRAGLVVSRKYGRKRFYKAK